MKKYFKLKKNIIYVLLFTTIFTFRNVYCYADEIPEDVDYKKEWLIKFNQSVDPVTINNQNIIVKDSNDNLVDGLEFVLLNNGQDLKIKAPLYGYKNDENYSLIISNNVSSLKGKKMKDLKIRKFKIKKTLEEGKIINSIIGKEDLSAEQMAKFVLEHNPSPKLSVNIYELAKMFLEEGKLEGVRGDIAFCQSIKETGYFKYGGQVLPEQNNYAGIGALNNSPVGKGAWFKEAREGVKAQIQHLKGYATTEELKSECVDPRYFILKKYGLLGVAPNWEDLNGKWAVPGNNYGQEIIKIHDRIKQIK
ncbi:glucosaminidase domain-containing protein [Clostridium sp. MB40-C1]|uniref:glucosaminidase domain-containing protein n=1 Tax=Clostridium sp. MB40-C1 TaxID=3070996 RepID=UPI0027E176B7|nr:glucosaminidase domain-containing protein [Clostridium sp. MB40-C1]WMJ81812.1 glucosaminidase domain-containing protein [Clostridium sp. MB40-C1]